MSREKLSAGRLWPALMALALILAPLALTGCPGGGGTTVIPVTSVSIGGEEAFQLVEGQYRVLTATVNPENATHQAVTWASSNQAVATVNQAGRVDAVSAGTTQITATAGGIPSAPVTVTVIDPGQYVPVVSISIVQGAQTVPIGQYRDLTVTFTPTNATTQTVTWASSNEAVATVSTAGRVTAVAVGYADITATSTANPAANATIRINVEAAAPGNFIWQFGATPEIASWTATPGTNPSAGDQTAADNNTQAIHTNNMVLHGYSNLMGWTPQANRGFTPNSADNTDGAVPPEGILPGRIQVLSLDADNAFLSILNVRTPFTIEVDVAGTGDTQADRGARLFVDGEQQHIFPVRATRSQIANRGSFTFAGTGGYVDISLRGLGGPIRIYRISLYGTLGTFTPPEPPAPPLHARIPGTPGNLDAVREANVGNIAFDMRTLNSAQAIAHFDSAGNRGEVVTHDVGGGRLITLVGNFTGAGANDPNTQNWSPLRFLLASQDGIGVGYTIHITGRFGFPANPPTPVFSGNDTGLRRGFGGATIVDEIAIAEGTFTSTRTLVAADLAAGLSLGWNSWGAFGTALTDGTSGFTISVDDLVVVRATDCVACTCADCECEPGDACGDAACGCNECYGEGIGGCGCYGDDTYCDMDNCQCLPIPSLEGDWAAIDRASRDILVDLQTVLAVDPAVTFATNNPNDMTVTRPETGTYLEVRGIGSHPAGNNWTGAILPLVAWQTHMTSAAQIAADDVLIIRGRVSHYGTGAFHLRGGGITTGLYLGANNVGPIDASPFVITRTLTAGDVAAGASLLLGTNIGTRPAGFFFSIDDLIVYRPVVVDQEVNTIITFAEFSNPITAPVEVSMILGADTAQTITVSGEMANVRWYRGLTEITAGADGSTLDLNAAITTPGRHLITVRATRVGGTRTYSRLIAVTAAVAP